MRSVIRWSIYDGGFWFRIFGIGFSIVNKQKHPPLFSERYGYRKILRIDKYGIEYLKNRKIVKGEGESYVGKPGIIS